MESILVESLKNYNEKESTIETTLARVEAYKKAIGNPDSFREIYTMPTVEVGMPTGKGGKPTSSVETSIQNTEDNREEIIETLREWIKEDLSRIYPLQIEIKQIKRALNALKKQDRHIIECRYFEKISWNDTEISFNNKFKAHLTYGQLQKRNKRSLEKLCKILKPYYERKYGVKTDTSN